MRTNSADNCRLIWMFRTSSIRKHLNSCTPHICPPDFHVFQIAYVCAKLGQKRWIYIAQVPEVEVGDSRAWFSLQAPAVAGGFSVCWKRGPGPCWVGEAPRSELANSTLERQHGPKKQHISWWCWWISQGSEDGPFFKTIDHWSFGRCFCKRDYQLYDERIILS